MFDIGWSEMAIIALVALVVLGPKELPNAMRTFANFSKKMRRYAQEFRAGVDNIVREADLEDARKALEAARSANPKNAVQKLIDPTGEMTAEIKSVDSAARDKGDATPVTAGSAAALPAPDLPAAPPSATSPTDSASSATNIPAPTVQAAADPVPVATPPSNIVTEPLRIAPAHSIRPPAPAKAPVAEPAQSAPPQDDQKSA